MTEDAVRLYVHRGLSEEAITDYLQQKIVGSGSVGKCLWGWLFDGSGMD